MPTYQEVRVAHNMSPTKSGINLPDTGLSFSNRQFLETAAIFLTLALTFTCNSPTPIPRMCLSPAPLPQNDQEFTDLPQGHPNEA